MTSTTTTSDLPGSEPPGVVTLTPDRRVAGRWSTLAGLVFGVAVWTVVDSRGHALAWVFAAVATSLLAFFLIQAVVPRLFTIRMDDRRVWGRLIVTSVDVAWETVLVARVRTVVGETVLDLHVRGPDGSRRSVDLLLPLGTDLADVHAFLERRLGRLQT